MTDGGAWHGDARAEIGTDVMPACATRPDWRMDADDYSRPTTLAGSIKLLSRWRRDTHVSPGPRPGGFIG